MQMINSSLNDEAIEVWFERGATQIENGNFRINRDVKLNLSSPPIMGHDQMVKLHNVILDSNIDVLHLRPLNPEKLTGATYQEIEKFKKLTEDFVK